MAEFWDLVATFVVGTAATALPVPIISFFGRRRKQTRLAEAAKDVVRIVRGTVADDAVPTRDEVEKIRAATARRYRLRTSEIVSTREVANELLRQIWEESLLTPAQRQAYAERLKPLMAGQDSLMGDEPPNFLARPAVIAFSAVGLLVYIVYSLSTVLVDGIPPSGVGRALRFYVPLTLMVTVIIIGGVVELSDWVTRRENRRGRSP